MNLDLGRDAPDTRKGLMDEIMRIGKAEPSILGDGKKDQGGRARDQPHADYANGGRDEADHVEDGITRIDVAAGGVDKNGYRFASEAFEEEELADETLARFFIYFAGKKDCPCLEETLGESFLRAVWRGLGLIVILLVEERTSAHYAHGCSLVSQFRIIGGLAAGIRIYNGGRDRGQREAPTRRWERTFSPLRRTDAERTA